MKMLKKRFAALLMVFTLLISANSVFAAPVNDMAAVQSLAQQIVMQQVAAFQAQGQVLTPDQLAALQQNALLAATQQVQAQQAAAIQAQQAAAIQAQQAAAIQAQQAAALQAQQAAALQVQQPVIAPVQSVPGTVKYIANMNTKKFHYPVCSSVNEMASHNKLPFEGTRDQLIAKGYVPCKRCNP